MQINKVEENIYDIEPTDDMRVPARIYGSEKILSDMQQEDDATLEQISNVATLPGIQKYSVLLPDGHQGYGFPIGGVAAVDIESGVISPGGIGFDINCGVRLLRTNLTYKEIQGKEEKIGDMLYEIIPVGLGKGCYLDTDQDVLKNILKEGMDWMLKAGYATDSDLEHCEENGRLPGNPKKVPSKAKKRGINQIGSLGSGNHFLEVQKITDIYNKDIATEYDIKEDQIVVMIHSGSRGFGHQICTEYVRRFEKEYPDIVEALPDKQLIYAPLEDQLAEDYFEAMNAAANFAWANRQAMTDAVRVIFDELFKDSKVELLYDVCHNIAKKEKHTVNGEEKTLLVHRKGATRAFPAGRPEVPEAYRNVGQPVLIPGSMGGNSYILSGGEGSLELTFGSTAHGAGRAMSRTQAKKEYSVKELQQSLSGQQIYVRSQSDETLTEEAPGAYKNVDEVISVSDALGIGKNVAKMQPIANIKG